MIGLVGRGRTGAPRAELGLSSRMNISTSINFQLKNKRHIQQLEEKVTK